MNQTEQLPQNRRASRSVVPPLTRTGKALVAAVITIVTGIRNSIQRIGSTSAPVAARTRVTEWPTVNAVMTHSASRQSCRR